MFDWSIIVSSLNFNVKYFFLGEEDIKDIYPYIGRVCC